MLIKMVKEQKTMKKKRKNNKFSDEIMNLKKSKLIFFIYIV